jgi:thiamine pyrophosphokinase
MAQVMSVVRHVMELQTAMDTKLKGTIVQVGRRGKRLDWSLSLLDTLYKPKNAARRVYGLVDTDEDAEQILEGILAHEAEKQARRRRMKRCV